MRVCADAFPAPTACAVPMRRSQAHTESRCIVRRTGPILLFQTEGEWPGALAPRGIQMENLPIQGDTSAKVVAAGVVAQNQGSRAQARARLQRGLADVMVRKGPWAI